MQLRCLCCHRSGLQKPGRRTQSRSTPAFTAAVSTTRATSSERRIGQVREALAVFWLPPTLSFLPPSCLLPASFLSSLISLCSESQGRFPEPGERHHRDPGQHGGRDHRGGEDHQTCRWAPEEGTETWQRLISNDTADLRFSALSGRSETGPRGLDR